MIPTLISDINSAEPTKYEQIIMSTPPTIGTHEPCLLPKMK